MYHCICYKVGMNGTAAQILKDRIKCYHHTITIKRTTQADNIAKETRELTEEIRNQQM